MAWAFPQPEPNSPYQSEWEHLIDAIRNDKPYNEVKRGVEASLVTSMGRMAAHTGQVITYDQILNCDHEFAPSIDQLAMNSPSPLQVGPDGKYPIPRAGHQEESRVLIRPDARHGLGLITLERTKKTAAPMRRFFCADNLSPIA